MNRRELIRTLLICSSTLAVPACALRTPSRSRMQVMTVNGLLDTSEMGVTLVHEHLFADLRSYEEQMSNALTTDIDEVVEVVKPYLASVQPLGCRTLIDCTATQLGRSPTLIKRLSAESGLHMLTVTGNYLAADGRFVPQYVHAGTVDQLARRWIDEFRHGIEGTDVRPGLIKLGVNGGSLTALEDKVFRAAIETHLETGLTIAAHVGPWREVEPGFNGLSASDMLDRLENAGVSPSAWIWYHAQNERDLAHVVRAAERGAWIAFDGLAPDSLDAHIALVKHMRARNLLDHVLVSHDAGWYTAGEPRGGTFRAFDTVFAEFIPALRAQEFSDSEIAQLFVRNPAEAFALRKRLL
jgi:predicted metal-dependent phosphotriesterase family hydrolase